MARLPQFAQPAGIAVDPAGNVYFAEAGVTYRVLKVTPAGVIAPVAGSGEEGDSGDGGPATSARLRQPWGLALDSASNVFIADIRSHVIRKVTPDGTISTVAGTGNAGYSGDSGPATAAALNEPVGIALDHAGYLYIADGANNRIRKVAPNGIISTVAGTGNAGYSGDGGPATSAQLNLPGDVALDQTGCLYIVDLGNRRVRVVTQSGTINTVAGNGQGGFSGNGVPATLAQLDTPAGIAIDNKGNLYITDYGRGARIRQVTPGGIISTVAGTDHEGYAGDGGPAISAWLDQPLRVAVDSAGNLYISDTNNDRIRKVSAG
jgi:NHL repeat-containing protein